MNRGLRRRALLLVVAGMLAVSGCAGRWPGLSGSEARHADNASLDDLMAFVRHAVHFSPAENARERALLTTPEPGPGAS